MTTASACARSAAPIAIAKRAPARRRLPMSVGAHSSEFEKRLPRRGRVSHAKSKTASQQAENAPAARSRLSETEIAVDVPTVPRGEDAASHLPEVRLLQRPRSHRRKGRVLV